MPDDNVERVLTMYAAFNARDEDVLVRLYDPDVRILSFAAAVEGDPVFSGHDGVRAWFRNLVETISARIEPGGLFPHRRYVLTTPIIHVEAGDGFATTFEQGIVYEFRNGLITGSYGYKDPATALIELGKMLRGDPAATQA